MTLDGEATFVIPSLVVIHKTLAGFSSTARQQTEDVNRIERVLSGEISRMSR
jgi:hypothetical protein